MENIDDIKTLWNGLNSRLERLEEENKRLARHITTSNMHTAQQKLMTRYLRFIAVEAIMIVFVVLFFLGNPFINDNYRVWLLIAWLIFFLVELALDLYLYINIKEIDIYRESVSSVAARARHIWRVHKIGVLCGIPLAIGVVALFLLSMDADRYMVLGVACGAFVGCLIGLREFLKFRKSFRDLQQQE